jgi:CubicO group peptidase (beta-lactamase class C family)
MTERNKGLGLRALFAFLALSAVALLLAGCGRFKVGPGMGPQADSHATLSEETSVPAAVDGVFRSEMREARIPSAMLALVHGDHVVLSRAWGESGPGHPADADTLFCIGSLSKSFTALGLMILADEGKVDLLAPVTAYLPGFRMADPRYRDIKVRDLLRHASGLSRSQGDIIYEGEDATADRLIARLAGTRLAHAPGERYDYCNMNYVLAGAIIEAVSGQAYPAFMEERVFRPLGMTRTCGIAAIASAQNVARGSQGFFGWTIPGHARHPVGATSAGYLFTSARDFAAYLLFLRRGGVAPDGHRLVSEAGFKAMTEAQTVGASYGYGWGVDKGLICHDGEVAGFVSILDLARDPEGWGFAFVLGKSDGLAESVMGRSTTRIEVGLYDILMPASRVPPPPISMDAYRAACLAIVALYLAFLAGQIVHVVRTRRTSRIGRAGAILLDAVLPLGVLIIVQFSIGPWPTLIMMAPDLACFLSLLIAGQLAVGGLRLVLRFVRTCDARGSRGKAPGLR